MDTALSRTEDDQLRRLHALEQYGALTAEAAEVLEDLRARDRRAEIRPPRLPRMRFEAEPREASSWVSA